MKPLKDNQAIQKPLFDLLFLIQIRMKEVVQEADSELSPLQVLVLRTLVADGEMSLITLARKIGRDKSQITRIIQDLENKKMVSKKRSQEDRRSFTLIPHKSVKEKVSTFIQKEHELVAEMTAGMGTADRQKLERLLIQMQDNMKD